MALSLSTGKIIPRLRNRGRIEAARLYLSLKRRVSGHALWFDHGCIKLPFHGDGDRQEIYYYLDGKTWWTNEYRSVSPYLRQGNVAVDVGANLGFMSGVIRTLTGPSGRVHAFEPSPAVYAKLLEVIDANSFTNVLAYNKGCGKQSGSMLLYSHSSSGNGTIRPNARMVRDARDKCTVDIVRLDDFLGPKLDRLDFLKIDTEGYEDEVLGGAAELLRKFKPVIYLELCSDYLTSSQNAVRILRDQGYTFDRELALEETHNGSNFFAFPPGYAAAV